MDVPEAATENLKKLPEWVKCRICGEGPKHNNWLIDEVADKPGQQSNMLIHMDCAKARGQYAGLNLGRNT